MVKFRLNHHRVCSLCVSATHTDCGSQPDWGAAGVKLLTRTFDTMELSFTLALNKPIKNQFPLHLHEQVTFNH